MGNICTEGAVSRAEAEPALHEARILTRSERGIRGCVVGFWCSHSEIIQMGFDGINVKSR